MSVSSTKFLGQLLPALDVHGFTEVINKEVSSSQNSNKIQLWVSSDNALKVEAARHAVILWANKYLPEATVEAKGFGVQSDISEQPHSKEETALGASNRLTHLRGQVLHRPISFDALQFFVSMENGIMQEQVDTVANPTDFKDATGMCWIDRCYVIVEVAYGTLSHQATALSEGVTTPFSAVDASRTSDWQKTCGSFIE